jgi:hypothetical protein
MIYRCIHAATVDHSEYYPEYNPLSIGPDDDTPSLVEIIGEETGAAGGSRGEHNDRRDKDDRVKSKDENCVKILESVNNGDSCSIKLRILEETVRKRSTIDMDGFAHICTWTISNRPLTSLSLMVQEG